MTGRSHFIQVRNILLITLLLNISVAIAKIIYGVISNSSSMTADGYHSLSDGASNIVGIIGAWIASKPADENHPYGHYKFETLATVVISLLLFMVAYQIGMEAYDRFKNPISPRIDYISFIVMIFTLIVNILVTRFESKKGKELKSAVLLSDATNKRSDIYVSISVIVSLIAAKYNFIIIDTIIAVIIALLIIKAGLDVLIPSINVLSDAAIIDPNKIYDIVIKYPEVVYCHKIRTRGKENNILIDFHVGMHKGVSLEKAHTLSHEIKDKILEEMQDIREIIIHMEPADVED